MGDLSLPERSDAIRRSVARFCLRLGWAPMHEMPLPNGRRADILALAPDGGFACIEVKSGVRDFIVDAKWPDYRAFCDRLYFAVDLDFPQALLPGDVGLIVACPPEAELVRDAVCHPIGAARRRGLMQRFAWLAASRLAASQDPAGAAGVRTALRAE